MSIARIANIYEVLEDCRNICESGFGVGVSEGFLAFGGDLGDFTVDNDYFGDRDAPIRSGFDVGLYIRDPFWYFDTHFLYYISPKELNCIFGLGISVSICTPCLS